MDVVSLELQPVPDDGTCETCRWWSGPIETLDGRDGTIPIQGVCGGIPSTWPWRLREGDPGTHLAMLIDSNAELLTAPTFGCRLWEAK